jgi:hypothetical protein
MIRDYLSNFILRAPVSSGRSNLLESLIQVRETRSAFVRTHNKRFPSPRCASTIQIVRP